MFLIRSSTRGRERGGEGEIQFFPPIVPENREPEEKDIEQSSKEGNEFSNYPIGFVYFYYLVFRIDRRRYRSNGSENESIESKASAGERGEGGREKGGKDFRSTKSSLVLFIFFCKRQTSSPPPFPLLLLFSLLRLTLSNEWERFAFYRASIQTRSNFARFTTIVPAFRKSIQSSQPCPLPASVGTSPIVTRPLFLRIRGDRESKIRSYSLVIFE